MWGRMNARHCFTDTWGITQGYGNHHLNCGWKTATHCMYFACSTGWRRNNWRVQTTYTSHEWVTQVGVLVFLCASINVHFVFFPNERCGVAKRSCSKLSLLCSWSHDVKLYGKSRPCIWLGDATWVCPIHRLNVSNLLALRLRYSFVGIASSAWRWTASSRHSERYGRIANSFLKEAG